MPLTREQVGYFRYNGFLKLPARMPEGLVQRIRDAVWKDVQNAAEPVVRDRRGRVVRISNLWQRDRVFQEAMTAPEVLDPLECLLGSNIELILNRHNHATLRLAEDGSAYLHRDVMQWTRSIVTVIFYLEETTVENGCTQVVPGSHLLLPGVDNLEPAQDERIQRTGLLEQAVPVPMPAGGLLAIDSLVIHGAGENHTPGTRMSMTAGYHSVDELSPTPNPARVLICGERIYHGNDRAA